MFMKGPGNKKVGTTMSEIREDGMSFVGYEYLEVPVKSANAALCLDGYQR